MFYENLKLQIQTYEGISWLQKAYIKSLRNLECKIYEEKNVQYLNWFLDFCFDNQEILGDYIYTDIVHTWSNDTTKIKYSVFYDTLNIKKKKVYNKSYFKFYFIFLILIMYYIFSVYDYINYLGIIHIRNPIMK